MEPIFLVLGCFSFTINLQGRLCFSANGLLSFFVTITCLVGLAITLFIFYLRVFFMVVFAKTEQKMLRVEFIYVHDAEESTSSK